MQELIVYRNPAEAAFWQHTDIFFNVILLGIIWGVVAVNSENVLKRFFRVDFRDANKYAMWIAHVVTLISAFLIIHYFYFR